MKGNFIKKSSTLIILAFTVTGCFNGAGTVLIEGQDYVDHAMAYDGEKFIYDDTKWYINELDKVPLPDPHVFVEDDTYYMSNKIKFLAQITRLRQICCDPSLCYEDYEDESAKLEMCIDLIKNSIEGGHKILLFSQFTSMLQIIAKRLNDENISFYTLTGKTSIDERISLVNRFNKDDTQVFLMSLKVGGFGLNLTGADIVIHYDPWWNMAVQNQATDRAHRIGQDKSVSVYKLIAKDSIEENIYKLQLAKEQLGNDIVNGNNISLTNLSKEELLSILIG